MFGKALPSSNTHSWTLSSSLLHCPKNIFSGGLGETGQHLTKLDLPHLPSYHANLWLGQCHSFDSPQKLICASGTGLKLEDLFPISHSKQSQPLHSTHTLATPHICILVKNHGIVSCHSYLVLFESFYPLHDKSSKPYAISNSNDDGHTNPLTHIQLPFMYCAKAVIHERSLHTQITLYKSMT